MVTDPYRRLLGYPPTYESAFKRDPTNLAAFSHRMSVVQRLSGTHSQHGLSRFCMCVE